MSKSLGSQLAPEIISLINDKKVVVVLATVSTDGYPNTAPMHLLVAKDSKRLLVAMGTMHQTYKNIKENGKVMLSLLEGGDIALSVKGRARVVKEPMDRSGSMAMVEVDILQVKEDTTPTVTVTDGVKTAIRSQKTPEFFKAMFSELINYSSEGVL